MSEITIPRRDLVVPDDKVSYVPNMVVGHPAMDLDKIMAVLTDKGFTAQPQICDTALFYAWKGYYGPIPVFICIPLRTLGDILAYVICQANLGDTKDFYLCDQGFNASVMKALELEWNPEDGQWHQTYNNMTALLTGQSAVIY